MQEPSKFCPRCNTQNYAAARYCYSCSFQFPDAEPGRRATKPVSTATVIFLGIFGCLIFSWIASLFRGDKATTTQTAETTSTAAASSGGSDYEKVVHNELGKMTIKSSGGSVTSIKLDAISADQKLKLRAMLVYLEVSDLTAQRACSLTLSFGGWSDRGDIHNCSGDRVGTLNSDAIGFMRDKVNESLQRGK